MTEVCQTALFRAKELDLTSSRDELHHSKQGLECRELLTVTSGRPVFTAHLCVGRPIAVRQCLMDTSAPVLNTVRTSQTRLDGAEVSWVRSACTPGIRPTKHL